MEFIKKKKSLLIIIISAVVLITFFINPIKRITWAIEQSRVKDKVVHTSISDRFALFTAFFKEENQMIEVTLTYETHRNGYSTCLYEYAPKKELYIDISDCLSNDTKNLEIVTLSYDSWDNSEYKNVDKDSIFSESEILENSKKSFYIWDDKYLVNKYDYGECRIFSVDTGKRYYGLNSNEYTMIFDENVWYGDSEPRTFMTKNGQIFVLYKFYNKLYIRWL